MSCAKCAQENKNLNGTKCPQWLTLGRGIPSCDFSLLLSPFLFIFGDEYAVSFIIRIKRKLPIVI